MKKMLTVLLLIASISISIAKAQTALELTAKTDKADAIYQVSEKVKFTFEASESGSVFYNITIDSKIPVSKGSAVFEGEPIVVESSLDEPGILKCSFGFKPKGGEELSYATAAAAIDPLNIKSASVMPDDFDQFWGNIKYHLSLIPLKAVMTPLNTANENMELFDVQADCIGMPLSGYYGRPKAAVKRQCPAIIFLHGAGVSSARTGRIEEYVNEGFIAMDINAHGIPNGMDSQVYADMYKNELLNYRHWGKENQYTCYFTGMFTRVYRGLQFLKSQPQWDGKILISYGSSQGGAQSLAAAGLDEDVNFAFAGVPAMCEHGGKINGWPKFVPVEKDGSYNKQILDAAMYNDCVNFSRRAKAKALFTVGFIDQVCPPTSVYAAFNEYAGEKEILTAPAMGHALPTEHVQESKKRILEFVRSMNQ